MTKKILYTDYIEYTEENDTESWFAFIKYKDQEEIKVHVSKAETIEAVEFVLNDQSAESIPIGNRIFKGDNLDYISLEGITFQF